MAPLRISLERADQPDVVALIEALDAYQQSLYPPESNHLLDISALLRPEVLFAVARTPEGEAVGCGAIVLGADYGEVKRMFVRPERRGGGAARQVLAFLESAAAARGCRLLRLETGIHQHEALRFYERAGYTYCARFGDYPVDPLSVYLEKRLPAAA
jgi:putative acetyltransferase